MSVNDYINSLFNLNKHGCNVYLDYLKTGKLF